MSTNVERNADLNKASLQDLERIQVIGKDHARKILDFRTKNGEFKTWEDVRKVPGITSEMLDSLRRSGYTISGRAA